MRISNFEVGQRIMFIDDLIAGTIAEIAEDVIYVITDEGFRIESKPSEILPEQELTFDLDDDMEQQLAEKGKSYLPKKSKTSKLKGQTPPMEVDLHIHQLTGNERGMSAYDKLNLQLDVARQKLEFAIKKRIQRVVFIHGVGAGVLRTELAYLFSRYEQVTSYDADFQKYGFGATEVYIYQNF